MKSAADARLFPRHVADLKRSGLSDETIALSGAYSTSDPARIARLLNWERPVTSLGDCLVIPFPQRDGTFNCFASIKPDRPRVIDGKPVKYEHPRGLDRQPYFAPLARKALSIDGALVTFTEGAKKALRIEQAGFPCVAISGVNAWSAKRDKPNDPSEARRLNTWLSGVNWSRRPVAIVFDTDQRRNPDVGREAVLFAVALSRADARPAIVNLPVGPAGEDGLPCKMGADDFLVEFGDEAFRQIVLSQLAGRRRERSLDDWRSEMARSRVDSIGTAGVFLDASPTGAGKSYSDMPACQRAGSSLTINPSHKQCRQTEKDYVAYGLPAAAYPALNKDSCLNFEEATRAIGAGLPPSGSVCLSCAFGESCEYRPTMKLANESAHRIATHKRAELSFEQIAEGRKYITIHEDAGDILRPSIEISQGLEDVEKLSQLTLRYVQSRAAGDRSAEYFLWKMESVSRELRDYLGAADSTKTIDLPTPAPVPPNIDRRLWEAMTEHNLWPIGDVVKLVKSLAAGQIAELAVRVDETFSEGRRKATHRAICGIVRNSLPLDATIWISDATATATEIEALAGTAVRNATPAGEIERRRPAAQIALDIKRSTSRRKVVNILRGVLLSLPQYGRIGVICDRRHLPAIDGTAKDGIVLEKELRQRISRTAYYRDGSTRGDNGWYEDCDLLIVAGTPRVPPSAIRSRLIRQGKSAAAGRSPEWTSWGPNWWLGKTVSGKLAPVRSLGYRDHDWHSAYRSVVASELLQAAGRGRSILETGIPVVVLSDEPLGLPLVDVAFEPLTSSDVTILSAIRSLSAGSVENGCHSYDNHFLNNNVLGKGCHSTTQIAALVGRSRQHVLCALSSLADRGFLTRRGQRGGWSLSPQPAITLSPPTPSSSVGGLEGSLSPTPTQPQSRGGGGGWREVHEHQVEAPEEQR